uniref:Uncharacterized protein n=1 Tax=Arion vulgaris TaxID=1028688 RepID=A0A0B6ZEG5_9EUPU
MIYQIKSTTSNRNAPPTKNSFNSHALPDPQNLTDIEYLLCRHCLAANLF